MNKPNGPQRSADLRSVLGLFVVWKLVLLTIAAASPGPGYDTSTDLLLTEGQDPSQPSQAKDLAHHVLLRLVRWDSVYFVNIAQRGYLYEQEWAFGRGFMSLIGQVAKVFPVSFLSSSPLLRQALAGSIVAHLAHALTALFLYELTLRSLPEHTVKRNDMARLAACLHILSPAGIFLSAPYTEALFASLNVLGMLCLAMAPRPSAVLTHQVRHFLCFVSAGVCFALASTVRGNGIFSNLAFVVLCLPSLFGFLKNPFNTKHLFVLVSGAIGVMITVAGTVGPQYLAWTQYCNAGKAPIRPWCTNVPPSIYTFVQKHYWGNGFLAYWTISNMPLFLIAAPTLILLSVTASMILLQRLPLVIIDAGRKVSRSSADAEMTTNSTLILQALAAPQLLLSVLALTNFHVQIINRISSGYPAWYMVLAMHIVNAQDQAKQAKSQNSGSPGSLLLSAKNSSRIVKVMTMYAMIQGGLYASFLPPA
ncbi:hypothetical protein CAC42_5679 [Sphaceloma murrayae]|uniref:GPI mannosyltransferase 2 n=1 Tax=Sphaceloma murrayae TaxID=2082308 RepID=A0A2K1QYX5_9PEZI|nr:hypothetical protein CAC42_5679 [Sphaceloma murrayae]